MAADFHPIFVHFPIALLTVYAVFECMRFKLINKQQWWTAIKVAFLSLGVLGTFVALATGDGAEQAYRDTPTRDLVEMHSTFGAATAWLFSILAVLYIVTLVHEFVPSLRSRVWLGLANSIAEYVLRTWWIIMPLALIGLALVTITGALGGAIVYGPDADPAVALVAHALGF